MLRLLFIFIVMIFIVLEFWFLTGLHSEQKLSFSKVKTEVLPMPKDKNRSKEFFNLDLWELTPADYTALNNAIKEQKLEEKEIDKDAIISIVSKKNSKQLCRGEKCMTIKGFLSNTLLLDDGNQTIKLKPLQIIFDEIKFIRFTDTKLYFENNKSSERYELEFFSYKQLLDLNDTNNTKKDIR